MLVGTNHISIVKNTRRTMSNHLSGASAPTLNTWIVVVQLFVLLMAVFLMERHLRKVEHPSRALCDIRISIALPALRPLCLHVGVGIRCDAHGEF
jgi:hypothetical protein